MDHSCDADSLKTTMLKDASFEKGLVDYVTPILSADLRAMSTYNHTDTEPLDIPLTLMKGSHELINEADMLEWKKITTTEAALFTFPGNHFYLLEQEAAVVDFIGEQLSQVLQPR